MIWNTRKPVTIEIDNVKFTARSPDVLERAAIFDILQKLENSTDIFNAFKLIMRLVSRIEGLPTSDGQTVNINVKVDTDEFNDLILGFNYAEINAIIDGVLRIGTLSDTLKKN